MKIVDFSGIIGYFSTHGIRGREADAHRDWKNINLAFIFFLAIILLFGGFLIKKSSGVMLEKVDVQSDKIVLVNKEAINIALEIIKRKEASVSEKIEALRLADPSF